MDFFAEQDRARRNLRRLIVLFALAVLLLIVLVNAILSAFLWFGGDYNVYAGGSGLEGYLRQFSWDQFLGVGAAVAATVGLVSLVRWIQLSSGGKYVAEAMGGRRVLPQTDDRFEKRGLNIVQEMALAANMPVPDLYVLPAERGINAFAAGITTADAVVAVTRGTLLQLSRAELQGVIGHEFSHILNGDMRLGIRLAALVKGITFIGDVGHFLLRAGAYGMGLGRRRDERNAALPIVGLALLIVGWLGALAAGFIKAAISRQKEYLADASAVQFTRDNSGIANALKVIGGFVPGSLVHAARAGELGHLFFGEVRHSLWDGFATHPPLERRIRRLEPSWDGEFISRREVREVPLTPGNVEAGVGRAALVAAAAAAALDSTAEQALETAADGEFENPVDEDLPPPLRAAILEPLGAMATALGLLISRNPQQRDAALAAVREHGARGEADAVVELLPALAELTPGQRFPLIARAMPALRAMSTPQYRQFKSTLLAVVRADRQTDLFEWCLFQLLRHYLDPEYLSVKASRPRYSHVGRVRGPLRVVLSVLAHQGDGDSERAFGLAVDELKLAQLSLLPLAECSVAEFSRAVTILADCFPLIKPRILKAMALAAGEDGQISAVERELVVAVAAVMDCPVPDSFALDGA
ncbi:MAG: M48 family metallopeptidase [Pseudomonadota bacterium]